MFAKVGGDQRPPLELFWQYATFFSFFSKPKPLDFQQKQQRFASIDGHF